MKMIFFSADREEVEFVAREFDDAGISCEIRAIEVPAPSDAELWIFHDEDSHRALMLCVHQGIGFARRAKEKPAAYDPLPLAEALAAGH